MKEIFVPYEIAKKLKEIGFNAPCLCFYDIDEALIFEVPPQSDIYLYLNQEIRLFDYNSVYNELEEWQEEIETYYSAPTWEQVFKWFREKGIVGYVKPFALTEKYHYVINNRDYFDVVKSFEKARELLILEMIKIYKEKNKNEFI